jgi:DNA-binding response OmpR family regulator
MPNQADDRLTILVVEDDPIYAQFIAGALRAAGHTTDIATNGAEARVLANALKPDAVILDLGLPDGTGYEIAHALRNGILQDRAVIILLTANMFPERDLAEAVDIDMVLTKPVEPSVVTGMVDLMRERRAKRLARRPP